MHAPPEQSPEESTREASQTASKVTRALALAAPVIAVLQSPAFAAPKANAVVHGTAANIPINALALDPPSLVAAGTAIATIGAYQLMRARGRKKPDVKESADS